MYYFRTYTCYIEQLNKNYEPVERLKQYLHEHPDGQDAKRSFDAVLLTQKDDDELAASNFVREMNDGLAEMRRNNRIRLLEKPDAYVADAIMLFKEIDCPPDGLIKAMVATVGSTALARLALVSICKRAWAHDPGHKLPPELFAYKKPMPEQEVAALIDKLEVFMERIKKPDAARKAKRYATEADLLKDVLGLDDDLQQLFIDAIHNWIEKY